MQNQKTNELDEELLKLREAVKLAQIGSVAFDLQDKIFQVIYGIFDENIKTCK